MTRRLPLVLSALALFIALGGPAVAEDAFVAAKQQLTKNSVASKHVKNGSLRVKDFRAADRALLEGDQGIQGPKGDKGDRGETGPTGPTGTAGEAFKFRATSDTGPTEILRHRGLILEATCSGIPDDSELLLVARTEADGAMLAGARINNFGEGAVIRDAGLAASDAKHLTNDPDTEGGGHFVFETAAGEVTSVVFGFQEQASATEPGCWLAGTATPGG